MGLPPTFTATSSDLVASRTLKVGKEVVFE
jgi:hypothetical protein